MRIGILAIEQHKSKGAQSIDQRYQADLACIASPFQRSAEHALDTPQGAELDLLLVRGNRRIGIEVKCTESPVVTRSMEIAMKDLRLQKLWLIHRGDMRFTMRPGIEALPVAELGALSSALD